MCIRDRSQYGRALASAGYQDLEGRDLVEWREGQLAQLSDLLPYGVADQHRPVLKPALQALHLVISGADCFGLAGEHPVHAPEDGILLMEQGRDLHRACS